MVSCGKELRNWLCFLLSAIMVGSIFPIMQSDSLGPYISYEIIIPRQLKPGTGSTKKEGLSYVIKAAGKEHIIRLKQKNKFLAGNLPVFTYDSVDRKVKSHPYVPTECYYGGYVEGSPDSLVALSTCFGLRGFLKIRGLNYGIEPLKGSRTFQHLLYLTNKTSFNSTVCGLRVEDADHQAEVERGKANSRFLNDPLYIKLYIVVENMMFRYEGGNETRVIRIVFDTINMVYTYYHFLNIYVILVGMDIWKKSNPIEISSNSRKLLDDFNEWKTAQPKEVKRDTTHLFVHQRFEGDSWMSHLGAICKPNFSVAIGPYLTGNLFEFSITVSHVLGHSLGIDHDGPNCFCDTERNCIMHGFHTQFPMFSNCSVASLSRLKRQKDLDCLRNVPDRSLFFRFKHCGNKMVDAGEQCDCGGEVQCGKDSCCYANCTFKPKAVCDREDCCQNCRLATKGRLCRDSVGLCDLPEYCTGKSKWCPVDVYKQDGTSCDNGGHCYAKKCLSHRLQCTHIFGEGARPAPQSCFEARNMVGDEVGNCGGDGKGRAFVKCKVENVLCGRLQCSNVAKKLDPRIYAQSLVNGVSCWGIRYQHGRGTTDRGAVPDGTVCSRGKICMNYTCVSRSVLKSMCDPTKCHHKGVCNNRGNCHCFLGSAPPNCRYFGIGGSIDSGPPTRAFVTYVMKYVLTVGIPLMMVGLVLATLLGSRMRPLFSRYRQRIPCWR